MSIELLKSYDLAYQSGTPKVSDTEYDNLKDTLRKTYPNDPYFQTVGAPVTVGRKVKLGHTIGSLNKKNSLDIQNWTVKYKSLVVSEKLDGSGIYVVYDNGKLVSVATRGDGAVGQNITDKARHFLPNVIMTKDRLVLRGEAMLLGNDHTLLGFKNKRNGVAGLLNRIDYSVTDVAHVVPFFHEVIEPEMVRESMFPYITQLGFRVPRWCPMDTEVLDTDFLTDILTDWKSTADYEIDGLVLSNASSYREDTYYPDNSVAFKVNQESLWTTVIDVEWNMGRTGRCTPTVVFEPLIIGGNSIQRATAYNAKYIKDNDIKPGTKISIVLAGCIIPHITEVINEI